MTAFLETGPPMPTEPPPEYFEMLRQGEEERLAYGQGQGDGHHQAGHDHVEPHRVLTLEQYMVEPFPPVEPLIGTPAAALLVRGEGLILTAPGGVGKTTFLSDGLFKLALALKYLGYMVAKPVRSCMLQAEIPGSYYQQMVRRQSDGYSQANEGQAVEALRRIHIPLFSKVPDLGTEDGLKTLREVQQETGADLIIIDPYLSFFPNVNENDNGAVRAALDRLKFDVLLPGNCGAIIADHQAKPQAGQDGGNDPRGAGAKRDWCAALIAMKRTKTPDGEHGDFLKLTLDKLRYGPVPRDPLTLHRDPFSGRFELWHRHSVPPERVAELVSETEGGQSKNQLIKLVTQELTLSGNDARALIETAVAENLLTVEEGPNRSQRHYIGPAYMPHRGAMPSGSGACPGGSGPSGLSEPPLATNR
ncbi:AAA family ATPase [Desulfobulbus alkaliphilus]|uniref:AAA family ATPase n=1 Tax=Desulfobulbus alkaliphilus TaxID=869814 RepID=UPI001965DD39|nr:AAA family ATPase [Desulfobulbus alkaliphilus]MBM9536173.1 AAA family ATPase [Desulfobulbus alkaliphilus]